MGLRLVYAATSIGKEAQEVDSEGGSIGKASCTIDKKINVTAPTLAMLLKKLGDQFGISIDDVYLPIAGGEAIDYASYSRYEDADGDELSDLECRAWRDGKNAARVWLAEYSFTLETRQVARLTKKDFEYAQIKHH